MRGIRLFYFNVLENLAAEVDALVAGDPAFAENRLHFAIDSAVLCTGLPPCRMDRSLPFASPGVPTCPASSACGIPCARIG